MPQDPPSDADRNLPDDPPFDLEDALWLDFEPSSANDGPATEPSKEQAIWERTANLANAAGAARGRPLSHRELGLLEGAVSECIDSADVSRYGVVAVLESGDTATARLLATTLRRGLDLPEERVDAWVSSQSEVKRSVGPDLGGELGF